MPLHTGVISGVILDWDSVQSKPRIQGQEMEMEEIHGWE